MVDKQRFAVILAFVGFLAVVALVGALLLPGVREAYIKEEIEEAKYCQVDSDCVDAGGKCPFGCYAFVNKDQADRIRGLIDSFDSKCVYGCVMCNATCQNNTCTELCS